jgi:hypothetical protein
MYHAFFSLTCLILATEFLDFVKELKKMNPMVTYLTYLTSIFTTDDE